MHAFNEVAGNYTAAPYGAVRRTVRRRIRLRAQGLIKGMGTQPTLRYGVWHTLPVTCTERLFDDGLLPRTVPRFSHCSEQFALSVLIISSAVVS